MMRGKTVIVPGAINKVASFLPRFTPNGLSMTLADFAMRKSVREV
jgi:hypothetical protein